jgi:hypothetical protein
MHSAKFEKVKPPHTTSGCTSFSWARAGHLVVPTRATHHPPICSPLQKARCPFHLQTWSSRFVPCTYHCRCPCGNFCPSRYRHVGQPPTPPLVHVGRLDLESEGLILLTNKGSFSRACTPPAVGLHKMNRVLVKSQGKRKWPTLVQEENGQEGSYQELLSRILMDELQNRLA